MLPGIDSPVSPTIDPGVCFTDYHRSTFVQLFGVRAGPPIERAPQFRLYFRVIESPSSSRPDSGGS